ncbi:MAG: outer membrane protein OmpA-like peptidoglycan-associated protein [Polyangiales bacterium]
MQSLKIFSSLNLRRCRPFIRVVRTSLILGLLFGAFGTSTVHAQSEPWLLHLEPTLVLPLAAPQADRFGPGLSGAIGLSRAINRAILVGARLRGGFLFDGPTPTDPSVADPGIGTFSSLGLAFRLRPISTTEDPRRGTGLWLEAVGGVALTGGDIRATMELGAGFGFELGIVDIGPSIRYMHVFQPSANINGGDANLLSIGLEITFLDARAQVEEAEEVVRRSDRDYDGIVDEEDACPDDAEDFDSFEDEDGCPDPDNDQDGITDDVDSCPNDPEDIDGFEDEDGCPDPDNDRDGFLDTVDECPDEAEVVNGVDDEDGCPDEGLIELIDDRVVLEERVLFDFQRARVKSAARPVLDAIVELVRQHPEWTRMRIEGHADLRGSATYNRRLSERRARNVMRELVRIGVEAERIDAEGHGTDRPRDPGATEQAHQRNRRVEFVVTERRPTETAAAEGAEGAEGEDIMRFNEDAGGEQ